MIYDEGLHKVTAKMYVYKGTILTFNHFRTIFIIEKNRLWINSLIDYLYEN